ncbi:TIR domain-containing protein [Megalodesulfovibrio gigas]|uniref:Thoeris protein ThsB TIR-like domain-containing protein n=1 Tax=Megalodesulfovibrio gigas (strain ATCC 19364 / DSM 1382 / NCIMB 9332 / VKM B-1759) TaxID=1121448 RepID=T2GDG6_MEGG1|nr:TIR domain-containing protein [Megalodesulfovibrio gigas]AGW14156.1 hypothetical protein DGI_2407 [Megalodesulfovibrio gigas DSM 1382 = ATCC 19364]
MARRVFFSFHYQNDIWRVAQIRNCWVTKERTAAGFWDAAEWESIKRRGDEAIKSWINSQLFNTSVTIVLIGEETFKRKFVRYEILQSHARGNGLLGIFIHNLKDRLGNTSPKGANPFSVLTAHHNGRNANLSDIYPVYDWVINNGQANLAAWIENAASKAGRGTLHGIHY